MAGLAFAALIGLIVVLFVMLRRSRNTAPVTATPSSFVAKPAPPVGGYPYDKTSLPPPSSAPVRHGVKMELGVPSVSIDLAVDK